MNIKQGLGGKLCLVLTLLLLLSPAMSDALYGQNADNILSKASTIYSQSNGIEATFSLQMPGASATEGVITMKGEKFTLVTPDMKTWFDGKTQWVYLERNEEVNVSNPTGDELQMTNPVLLLGNYKKGFTATLKGESTAANGKLAYDIELLPKRKGDIQYITLQIEKSTNYPVGIVVEAKAGATAIRIRSLKIGVNQPDSSFAFRPADYPEAEVIDLR